MPAGPMPSTSLPTIAAAGLALLSASLPAAAQAPLYRGEYTLTFLGIRVARVHFDSRIDQTGYSIDGRVSAAGLAAFFYDTSGTLKAEGRIGGRAVDPTSFRADYVYNDKPHSTDIRFAGGKVATVENLPPPPPRAWDWIPLGPKDLAGAVDPIAATLVKAASLDAVCRGRARMFDGEMRADLTLSPVAKGSISVPGYKGTTVTCRMRLTPVSGYRKGRKALEYLRNKSRIMVTFAPLGQTGLYAPIRATIGTEIGTIAVQARRFEATPQG